MSIAGLLGDNPVAMEDRAEELAAVRRVDWRFLLPDPSLGRVAYLAPHDPAVAAALGAVASSVDLLDGHVDAGDYDVAVVTAAAGPAVAAAAGLLRPGGWVCVERPGRAAGGAARTLRDLGLEAVAAHWTWPRAEACRELVPLQTAALSQAIGRRDPGSRLRLRVRLARWAVRTPLVALLVRDAIVIGRAP